eukprot:TRINITY_DN13197_c0_g1_i1.p1 TRINITY_DN13197_c0_g1~~TRINITY_DN13197_c0_g1_i1.p1  ORF type:complete len:349 (+),score=54.62 TRINITY_DN13197_c0_g1_i1:45-1049(+)
MWECQKCTLMNHPMIGSCEACGSEKDDNDEMAGAILAAGIGMPETSIQRVIKGAKETGLNLLTLLKGVQDVEDLSGEGPEGATTLLENAKWDVETAKKNITDATVASVYTENHEICECTICYCDIDPGNAVKLHSCKHVFCKECLKGQVRAAIDDGKTEINCLQDRCSATLNHVELKEICCQKMFETISRRGLEAATSTDPTLHHCPTPDCSYVVSWSSYEGGQPSFMCPVCTLCYCLACGANPYHTSMSCIDYKRTQVNDKDEKATEEYLRTSNIRICPSCGMAVAKGTGCDKMKCRCGCKFCYQCMAVNAKCNCTPSEHGFWDNVKNKGDFS